MNQCSLRQPERELVLGKCRQLDSSLAPFGVVVVGLRNLFRNCTSNGVSTKSFVSCELGGAAASGCHRPGLALDQNEQQFYEDRLFF